MARSLTITREEIATTSPLLTGFLIIAMGWLILSAMTGLAVDGNASPQTGTTMVISPK